MSHISETIFYIKDHECISIHDDGSALVGIADYAQENLDDITFAEFPTECESFSQIDTFGFNESVKAALNLFNPLDAKVEEINEDVGTEPRLLNGDPYEKGWLLKIRINNITQFDGMFWAEAHSHLV
ncbi:MAG: glycine cleavage system protein H [Verrucomicrobiota bacterium]|nr:glycine cleavage system protein H [Verrucomicrobiota bacterium]